MSAVHHGLLYKKDLYRRTIEVLLTVPVMSCFTKHASTICCLLRLSVILRPVGCGGETTKRHMNEGLRKGHHKRNAKNVTAELILEPFLLVTHSNL